MKYKEPPVSEEFHQTYGSLEAIKIILGNRLGCKILFISYSRERTVYKYGEVNEIEKIRFNAKSTPQVTSCAGEQVLCGLLFKIKSLQRGWAPLEAHYTLQPTLKAYL